MKLRSVLFLSLFIPALALADQLAQAEAAAGAAKATPVAQKKSQQDIADEGCRKKLMDEINKVARKKGVMGEFGVHFYENEPYKKAGLTAKNEQLYRYVTPPFAVEEGYISNSKADALVVFTQDSCRIEKLTVDTGGFTNN